MDGLRMVDYEIFNDILNIFEKEVSRNTKNKEKIYNFDKYKMQNINYIYDLIANYNGEKQYICKYNIFLITRPKPRIVMSLNIKDKVINHYVTRKYLIPRLEKYLDFRNVATRKGKGTDYARNLLKKYIEENKKYDNFYVLKFDISKYFYSIDHKMLKEMLVDKLPLLEYKFICDILNSTNYPYINKSIEYFKSVHPELSDKFIFYENGKGLPIGNMTSQFLSIFYLNEFDHKIIHDYKVKYFVHYMDDFILIDKDKKKLEKVFKLIRKELFEKYKLKLNENKSHITSIKNGFTFLGNNYKVINNKTIIRIDQKVKKRIKHRLKEVNYLYKNDLMSFESFFCSINTYLYSHKNSAWWMKRLINKEIFNNEYK